MSELKGIKIYYENLTKRLNENITTYEELLEKTTKLYHFSINEFTVKFFYLDQDDGKIEINKDEDFQSILKYHLAESKNNLMKIGLELEKKNFNVEQIMNNIAISESICSSNFPSVPPNVVKVEFNNNDRNSKFANSIIVHEIPEKVVSPKNSNIEKVISPKNSNIEKVEIKEEEKSQDIQLNKDPSDNDFVIVDEKFNEIEEKQKIIQDEEVKENNENLENQLEYNKNELKEDINKNSAINNIPKDNQNLQKEGSFNLIKYDSGDFKLIETEINQNQNQRIVNKPFDEQALLNKFEDIINKKFDLIERQLLESQKNHDEERKVNELNEDISMVQLNSSQISKENLNILKSRCDICSISPILGSKYLCMLCNDLVLCDKCEGFHNHPSVRFNNNFIGSKEQLLKLFYFSNTNNCGLKEKILQKFENHDLLDKVHESIKNSKFKVELSANFNQLFMKKNHQGAIEIKISNPNPGKNLPQGIVIYPLNNKDFEIIPAVTDSEIIYKKSIILNLICKSGDRNEKYKFNLIASHNKVDIQSNTLEISVTVGEDENSKLDKFFSMFPEIIALSLERKKIIYNIIQDDLSKKTPIEIMNILGRSNWVVEQAIEQLLESD